MAFRKYDPRAVNPETGRNGAHVQFEEKKLPPAKKN
jgi:large subunit ribosomal protein L33